MIFQIIGPSSMCRDAVRLLTVRSGPRLSPLLAARRVGHKHRRPSW